jgi:hypothetical protein
VFNIMKAATVTQNTNVRSWAPGGRPTPRHAGRLTVGRNFNKHICHQTLVIFFNILPLSHLSVFSFNSYSSLPSSATPLSQADGLCSCKTGTSLDVSTDLHLIERQLVSTRPRDLPDERTDPVYI